MDMQRYQYIFVASFISYQQLKKMIVNTKKNCFSKNISPDYDPRLKLLENKK